MAAQDLVINIRGDNKGANNAITQTSNLIKGMGSTALTATGVLASMGSAIAAISLTQIISDVADNVTETDNWARAIGVTTTNMQALEYAASKVSLTSDNMRDILKDLSEKIGDAYATGGGEAVDALKMLNLEASALVKLSPDKQLAAIAANIDKLGTKAEQSFVLESLANDATLLLPLLEDSGAELQKLTDQALNYGIALSQQDITKIRDMKRAFADVGSVLQGNANLLTADLAPAVTGLSRLLSESLPKGWELGEQAAWDFADGVVKGAGFVLDGLQAINQILAQARVGWLIMASAALTAMTDIGDGGLTFINNFLEPYRYAMRAIVDLISLSVTGWGLITQSETLQSFGEEMWEFSSALVTTKLSMEDIEALLDSTNTSLTMAMANWQMYLDAASPSKALLADWEKIKKQVVATNSSTKSLNNNVGTTNTRVTNTYKTTEWLKQEQQDYNDLWAELQDDIEASDAKMKSFGASVGKAFAAGGLQGGLEEIGGMVSGEIETSVSGAAIFEGSPFMAGIAGGVAGGLASKAFSSVLGSVFGSNIDPVVEELKGLREDARSSQSVLSGERMLNDAAVGFAGALLEEINRYGISDQVKESFPKTETALLDPIWAAEFMSSGLRFQEAVKAIAQATGDAEYAVYGLGIAVASFGTDDIPKLTQELISVYNEVKQNVGNFEVWAGLKTKVQAAKGQVADFNNKFATLGVRLDGTKASAVQVYQTLKDNLTPSAMRAKRDLFNLTDTIDMLGEESAETFNILNIGADDAIENMLRVFGDTADGFSTLMKSPITVLEEINRLAIKDPNKAVGYIERLINLSNAKTPDELSRFIGQIVHNSGNLGTGAANAANAITELVKAKKITGIGGLVAVMNNLLNAGTIERGDLPIVMGQLVRAGTVERGSIPEVMNNLVQSGSVEKGDIEPVMTQLQRTNTVTNGLGTQLSGVASGLNQVAASSVSSNKQLGSLMGKITVMTINTALKVAGIPGFAVGTDYVPRDMTANIHKGEMVIDPRSSEVLRKYGININQQSNDALLKEMQQLRAEVQGLRAETRSGAIASNKTKRILERVTRDGNALLTEAA